MIKPSYFCAVAALVFTVGCSNAEQATEQPPVQDEAVQDAAPVQDEAAAQSNKAAVEQGFQAWQEGIGTPFELLADNMQWTISGFNQYAGTYTPEPFQEELIEPFNQRIAAPLKPTQWEVYEDGNVVIINFDAETTLINGEQYQNSYAWFFTFEGAEVIEVEAFLDMPAFEDVLEMEVE